MPKESPKTKSEMKFEDLLKFVRHEMTMTRCYQPAVIRTLADGDGWATFRTLAMGLLLQDDSYVDDAEAVVRRWPRITLESRGIIEVEGKVVRLLVPPLNLSQRAELKSACDERLQSYWQEKGLPTDSQVSAGQRYRILLRDGGRCQVCKRDNHALDIDHVIPVSKGGTNSDENLQTMCYQCNRAKRDTDDTDFRHQPANVAECSFCDRLRSESFDDRQGWMFALADNFPVSDGHHLILPSRHIENYFDLSASEHSDAGILMDRIRQRLSEEDATITGFNVGVNSGVDAGQTVTHAHIHLIPRRSNDVEDPRGGVRGVIPNKKLYKEIPTIPNLPSD